MTAPAPAAAASPADQGAGKVPLPETCQTIAPDLPGFAGARDQPSPDTIEGFADHVLAGLADTGIDRFTLLGHSMGGMIAQEIARKVSHRVDRLVLYGTGALGRMPERFETIDASLERLRRDGVSAAARRITATWFVHGTQDPGFAALSELGAMASPDAARNALLAMAAWDGRAALSGLTMPSLIIWGDRDRSYRWTQVETLWNGLPAASLGVVPGASHVVHMEKPLIFRCIAHDFLFSERFPMCRE
jgi:pimeloyl-ACP methyl ester carboxylesterase